MENRAKELRTVVRGKKQELRQKNLEIADLSNTLLYGKAGVPPHLQSLEDSFENDASVLEEEDEEDSMHEESS